MDQRDRGRIACEMRCQGVDYLNPRGGWSNKEWNGLQVIVDQTDQRRLFGAGAFNAGAPAVIAELARAGCYITTGIKCAQVSGHVGFGNACPARWIDTSHKTVIMCANHFIQRDVHEVFVAAGKRGFLLSGFNQMTLHEGERSYDYILISKKVQSASEVLAWAAFVLGWRNERTR